MPYTQFMKNKAQIQFVSVCLAGLLAGSAQAAEWQTLFNGSDLAGWEQVGGTARFEVQGGEIVGYTVPNSPNSFLTTKAHYSDFILEYETRLDAPMNSGVQIRSNIGLKGLAELRGVIRTLEWQGLPQ